MTIIQSQDVNLLAELCYDVQTIHHDIEPSLFKAHNQEDVSKCFKLFLENPDTKAYIAFDQDLALGYIMLSQRITLDSYMMHADKALNIDHICVKKEAKGKGIGKALVDFAKAQAFEKNVSRITMSYWHGNDNSGEFFEHQGFIAFNTKMKYDIKK